MLPINSRHEILYFQKHKNAKMFSPIQVLCRIFLIFTEWLLFMECTTAYKAGCFNGYCFVAPEYKSEILTQSNAQNWCKANGTRLVEIRDGNIQDAISTFLNSVISEERYNPNTSIFTNGKRFSTKWTRMNGDGIGSLSVVDSQDSPTAYAFLQYSTSNFSIRAGRPTDWKNGYICQGEKKCILNGGMLISGKCYKTHEAAWHNWYDARQSCLASGGDLASLDFITDGKGLEVFSSSWLHSDTSYWIGIRRERWLWNISNSDVQYSNWDSNHPTLYPADPHDCLCIFPWSWKWKECRCSDTHPFLCFSESYSSKSRATPSTGSSTFHTFLASTATTTTVPTAIPGKPFTTDHQSNSGDTILTQEINSSTPAAPSNGSVTDKEAAIGIGIGVGAVIIAVVIVIAIVVIIFKHCRSSKSRTIADGANYYESIQSPCGDQHTSPDLPYQNIQVPVQKPQTTEAHSAAYVNAIPTYLELLPNSNCEYESIDEMTISEHQNR